MKGCRALTLLYLATSPTSAAHCVLVRSHAYETFDTVDTNPSHTCTMVNWWHDGKPAWQKGVLTLLPMALVVGPAPQYILDQNSPPTQYQNMAPFMSPTAVMSIAISGLGVLVPVWVYKDPWNGPLHPSLPMALPGGRSLAIQACLAVGAAFTPGMIPAVVQPAASANGFCCADHDNYCPFNGCTIAAAGRVIKDHDHAPNFAIPGWAQLMNQVCNHFHANGVVNHPDPGAGDVHLCEGYDGHLDPDYFDFSPPPPPGTPPRRARGSTYPEYYRVEYLTSWGAILFRQRTVVAFLVYHFLAAVKRIARGLREARDTRLMNLLVDGVRRREVARIVRPLAAAVFAPSFFAAPMMAQMGYLLYFLQRHLMGPTGMVLRTVNRDGTASRFNWFLVLFRDAPGERRWTVDNFLGEIFSYVHGDLASDIFPRFQDRLGVSWGRGVDGSVHDPLPLYGPFEEGLRPAYMTTTTHVAARLLLGGPAANAEMAAAADDSVQELVEATMDLD